METRTVLRIDGAKVLSARETLAVKLGKRRISQFKIAEKAGLHYVTVSNIERGAVKNVTLETAGKLAAALEVDVSEILTEDRGTSDDDEESDAAVRLRGIDRGLSILADLQAALEAAKNGVTV